MNSDRTSSIFLICASLMCITIAIFFVFLTFYLPPTLNQGVSAPTAMPTVTPTVIGQPTPSITVPTAIPRTADEALQLIRAANRVIIIASDESGPHSYSDTNGKFSGFEIELVKEMVRRWLNISGDPVLSNQLIIIPSSASERLASLDRETDADFLVGAVSYTTARCSGTHVCTTFSHFSDRGALVTNAQNSKVTTFCDTDLDKPDTYFLVLSNTTSDDSVSTQSANEYSAACSFINLVKGVPTPSRESAFGTVKSNISTIYKTDYAIARFYQKVLDANQNLTVLPDTSNKVESYVFWLQGTKTGLRDLIDRELTAMKDTNKINEICAQIDYLPNEPLCQ